VAQVLQRTIGLKHPLAGMNDEQTEDFLQHQIQFAPLQEFIGLAQDFSPHYVKEEPSPYGIDGARENDGL